MQRVIMGPYPEDPAQVMAYLDSLLPPVYYDPVQAGFPDGVDLNTTISQEVCGNNHVLLIGEWPERYRPFQPGRVGLLVTENDLKYFENSHPLSNFNFPMHGKKDFISGPDSLEAEPEPMRIARVKAEMGGITPVFDATAREVEEALRVLGVKGPDQIDILAEDREMILPECLKHSPVWDPYRDMPMIQECFRPGVPFPGHRVNELMNACGGVLNFLSLVHQSLDEAREVMENVPDTHIARVTYYVTSLAYRPTHTLPEQGIFITALEERGGLLRVEPIHYQMEEEGGVQFNLNDFDVPAEYWGRKDDRGQPYTIENLRKVPGQPYFKQQFASARAMRSMARIRGIPSLENPRIVEKRDKPGARFISNLNFGEDSQGFSADDKLGCYRRVQEQFPVFHHGDFEVAFLNAGATCIESLPQQGGHRGLSGSDELGNALIRRLMLSYVATVKPLGHDHFRGHPVMVERSVERDDGAALFNAMKFRATTAEKSYIFGTVSDMGAGFNAVMSEGQWGQDHKGGNPDNGVSYNMLDHRTLQDMIGMPLGASLGASEALIGSASSHIQSGNQDAGDYVFDTAQRKIVMTHGGGGRFIMGQFLDAAVRAADDGFTDFISLAMRVPLVSRKEGSFKAWMRRHELEPMSGDYDGNYLSCLDDGSGNPLIHVLTFNHIGERQHAILWPDVLTVFLGGVGTEYEFNMILYHNLMVEKRGYGILPGFPNNERQIPVHLVNSRVMNGGNLTLGYYDALWNSFKPTDRERLCMKRFDRWQDAREAADYHLESLGHDLWAPRYKPDPHSGLYLAHG
ncbi:MAG: hypothetical protein ACLFP8_00990 [Alphaproteobacteria bacterium]